MSDDPCAAIERELEAVRKEHRKARAGIAELRSQAHTLADGEDIPPDERTMQNDELLVAGRRVAAAAEIRMRELEKDLDRCRQRH